MSHRSTFPEVRHVDHASLEAAALERWDRTRVFERSLEERPADRRFTFYEGPPTANGRPGLHHMVARTIKDTFCRYKTMKGYRVDRKAGWDTHGLPVEIEVEKSLGFDSRDEVEQYGLEKFNQACRESVMQYKDLWDRLTVRMGYWVDLDTPYITFETPYIETVWWLIKKIHERGFLYRGHKIQWYSPGSETVLSSHEVGLGYKEVQDPSVYVRFPVSDEEATSFLAWTTTPWTLISNAALAVGREIDYVKVRRQNEQGDTEYLILAAALLSVLKEDHEVVASFKGRELVGRRYEPLFDYFKGDPGTQAAWRVVAADFVSTEEGTGIVHIAPAFGADDSELGKELGLPVLNPIRPDGRFDETVPDLEGQWFKEADKQISRMLRADGKLLRHETYLHNYPHDWRKGTPLMSYPVASWFIRTTAIKHRLIELNKQINWQPPTIGSGRFGQWLENNVDWAVSRNRFWGTPLPIWESDAPDSEYFEVIGSVAELREKCGDQLPDDSELDLHRPYVDELTWSAPDGGTMRRVPDLVDVWLDSGAMPFAQWHYPFENTERFEHSFPADFIAEGVDQTRGWFYTLHALAALVQDDMAYRNVVVNGLLLDENGEKMSKSKGNVVEPFETIEAHGADQVRWYIMSNSPPWENLKWSERGLEDTGRKFFGTLSNVYNFFATYANIDGFDGRPELLSPEDTTEMDRWIRSRIESTVLEVEHAFDEYHPTRAARSVESFVDDLSNWYIRRNRRRFWKSDKSQDKLAAYQTVQKCLERVAKIMAPIAPFYADWLYRSITLAEDDQSVHLELFPVADRDLIDADLEERVELARKVSSSALAIRNRVNINVRQPLPKLLVVVGGRVNKANVERMASVIRDEVNVREIEYVSGSSELVQKSAKPNFSVLGKRLGPLMKKVNRLARDMSSDEVDEFERVGRVTFDVEGRTVELTEGDLEITSHGIEGWEVEQVDGVTVALETTISPELRAEGYAREFTNRVQNLRKSAEFEVVDRIEIECDTQDEIWDALAEHREWIRNETLAQELIRSDSPDGERVQDFEIGPHQVRIGLRRIDGGAASADGSMSNESTRANE